MPCTQRIAILDDDIRFIRMVERVLLGERICASPITTLDQDEAVEIVAAGGFSLALIDIMMYGQAAGFQMIERLRAHSGTETLPLLVASGARRELGRRVDFLQRHNVGVLLKPFEPEDLLARVRAAGGDVPQRTPAIGLPVVHNVAPPPLYESSSP